MKKSLILIATISLTVMLFACNKGYREEEPDKMKKKGELPSVEERIKSFADVNITADMSNLTENQKKVVELLAEAGHLADSIFWKQTSASSIPVRDSLKGLDNPEAKTMLEYVMINYGPYDPIYGHERFVGEGPDERPPGGNFYPLDITKEEFNNYVEANPDQKEALENLYKIVRRDGDKLKAIPYHEAYPEVEKMAAKLEEAAEYCENESLKRYLNLRAEALRKDDYLDSDMAWMEIKDNDIDIVIGPIENYEDELFNYKTAFEAVVMIKDKEASKELDMFKRHLQNFEDRLPYPDEYKNESVGSGNILQVVNVAYFGGDCQKGVKTIAASLPNDPRVHEAKGGKKSMYKNMMEAKFDKIVKPIAEKMIDRKLWSYVDKKAFTSFVTLHEVAHTLGPRYVYGSDKESVRRALKERYSAIEETKADILGMWNHKQLLELGEITPEYLKKAVVTYVTGMYRSIRFGAEEAHGRANLIQLNYLKKHGAIMKQDDGTYTVSEFVFFSKVADLAHKILMIEVAGDYEAAGEIIEEYGQLTDEIKAEIESLNDVPRDIDTKYEY